MDRFIYIAMTGAKHIMTQQAITAHNLANVSTTGYRAEGNAFRALLVEGEGLKTRSFVVDSTTGADMSPGVIRTTGRSLDVAVQGKGWLAVQAEDGTEAYTRDGSLQLSANGQLQTRAGLNVLGDGGPISIPPDGEITIARDGTISAVPAGQAPSTISALGKLKLVNPPEGELTKGPDGLFRLRQGGSAPVDEQVAVASGALEGSNVNAAEALVNMISLSRQFDMQMKLLQNAETDAQKASQILTLNG